MTTRQAELTTLIIEPASSKLLPSSCPLLVFNEGCNSPRAREKGRHGEGAAQDERDYDSHL